MRLSPKPIDESTIGKITKYEKWQRANRLCLMIVKRSIFETIIGDVLKTDCHAPNSGGSDKVVIL